MKWLAHFTEDGNEQTIVEHSKGTAELAAGFAASFHMEKEASYIALMHDVGKYSEEFQRRLLHGGPIVDHSTAGAYEAFMNRKLLASFCIAGHHAGLPDGGSRSDIEGGSLYARLNRAKKGMIPRYDSWKLDINPEEFEEFRYRNNYEVSFLTRMLFSCLVDADFLDTERFFSGELERGQRFDVKKLEESLDNYVRPWFPPKHGINNLRCRILSGVGIRAQTEERGIFTLTVPTGGGKTVASLNFAIQHAKKNHLGRIIYVIPYTSIIEQTAEVFRRILGNEIVLEHHSNIEIKDDDKSYLFRSTENWDMPVIVTTAVQFFESFYKNKSSSARKLHNIASSVIIFDEAQMMPIPYLRPCVRVITELVKNYFSSAVLCTATQPALNSMIIEFFPEVHISELCPDSIFEDGVFSRVTFQDIGVISSELLANELNKKNQVLCIVNSRKAAKEVFAMMEGEGIYHLSTNMYPIHRKRVLAQIKNRLTNGLTCRVVSTSLIEAGVDIDFPVVYRQVCGLDSILQAGGRCNREGKRERAESKVFVFDLDCGSPGLFSVQIATYREMIKRYKDISSKEAVRFYFELLFYLKGEDSLDQKHILQRMEEENLPFESVSANMHLIDSNTRVLYVETEENENEINALKNGFASKRDYRKLGLYGINIYEYEFRKLIERHAVTVLSNGNCVLDDMTLYNNETGLNVKLEFGQAIFI